MRVPWASSAAQRLARIVLCALALFASAARAEPLQPVPALSGRIVDTTGTLAPQTVQRLAARLAELERSKGSQVAVLIVQTTEPEPIEQYALRVAEQWKLGRDKIDDGALLLIAVRDRRTRIEVGKGLEGALPDATAKRIMRESISPKFRAGDFDGGVTDGVDAMLRVIAGEALPEVAQEQPEGSEEHGLGFAFIAAFGIGAALARPLRRVLGGGFAALVGAGVAGTLAWLLGVGLVLGIVAVAAGAFGALVGGRSGNTRWASRRHRSGFGGDFGGFGSGGSGGGGGFDIGGFSGGGGDFGGGGASDSW